MKIRRAEEKDMDRMIELLQQVLEIHAAIRPDVFVSGTTKYGRDELRDLLQDEKRPIYVAADDTDTLMGYAFCQWREQPKQDNVVPYSFLYIDDLCVDEAFRGQHVGEQLFEHVKEEAKRLGCYEVALNVWTGNDAALHFYEKMGMQTRSRTMEYIL